MKITGLRLLLASFVLPMLVVSSRAQPSTSTQDVALTASIGPGAKQAPSLLLTLKNTGTSPVNIVTGMMVGSTPYPAAGFTFSIRFTDGRQSKLLCACSGPAIVAGSLGVYQVTLEPNKAFSAEIPLSDLQMVNGDGRLCTPETMGSQLTAMLTGRKPSDIVHPFHSKAPGMKDDSESGFSYWTGAVSQSVPLMCQSN
jgi:hypothetical protein